MASAPITTLRETVILQIKGFLYTEKFPQEPCLIEGILEMVNLISDYHEEGRALFPEVIIVNEKSLLETVPDLKIELGLCEASIESYKKIIKDCAPLSSSEWIIFIRAVEGKLYYGLTCAEITETTASLYNQTFGQFTEEMKSYSAIYIRNIGTKTVELCGTKDKVIIGLGLYDQSELSFNEVKELADAICLNIKDGNKLLFSNYFYKILMEGLKEGHGNLIVVVKDEPDAIEAVKVAMPDGTYLPTPINIVDLLKAFENEKSGENSVAIRHYSSVIKSMINTDGVTVFSDTGKLLGYHVIVRKDYLSEDRKKSISGGARTHTFYNLKESNLFTLGFLKSQDGPEKIFNDNE